MPIVGKIAGIILILITVPLFVLAACNASIDTTIRAPETYTAVLENDAIFEDLLPVALPALIQAASENQIEDVDFLDDSPILLRDVIATLSPEAWREVTNLLVSPVWLQERTEQLVTALVDIVNGNLEVINEPLDLTDLRQRLTGDEAHQATELILANAPECTQTQSDQIRTLVATGEGKLPICNPTDAALRDDSRTVFTVWFGTMATGLQADTPTIGEFLELRRDDARAVTLFFEIARQANFLFFVCPLALLSLVVMLAIRSVKGLGRWFGAVFVVSGLGVLLLLMATQGLAFSIVAEVLNARTELEVFLGRLAAEIVRTAFAQASGTMLTLTAVYIAAGFVFIAASWLLNRDDDDEGEMVLISEDGEIISTASQKRIGRITDGVN